MSHSRFLSSVRERELVAAKAHFPTPTVGGRRRALLELGAGTGQQALLLQQLGFDVTAIDLAVSHYAGERIFPVIDYDGHNVPCQNGTFDVIFSSNVLEHVSEIDGMLAELRRVMRDDALAVHLLPSPWCRLWGIPAHYIWLGRRVSAALAVRATTRKDSPADMPRTPRSFKSWLQTLFPLRHGERGCTVTEPYYYSRRWWCKKFEQNGFVVERISDNGLFYTMANSMPRLLSMRTRERLAPILGPACNLFVLRKSMAQGKAFQRAS